MDGGAVDGGDDVVDLDAGMFSGGIGIDLNNASAADICRRELLIEIECVRKADSR